MKILVINGANLDLLGKRDPLQYGSLSLTEIENLLTEKYKNIQFTFFHSPIEGDLVRRINKVIDEDVDAVIINPGGYAHTSVVIRDALEMIKKPKIEVHLSNIASREPFRHTMLTASVCDGYISGLKQYGYVAAVEAVINQKGGILD